MQELNRTRNTKRNIVWGFFNKLVILLGPFVTRTVLIYTLGAEYLGVNSLYTSILQVLSLAELGFATAVVYSMYDPVAKGDISEVARYLNYFKRVYRWVGVAIVAMGILLMPLLGFLVKGEWPDDVNMQLAFAIYLANTALSYFLFAYKRSLLNAYQRNDAVNKVNAAIMALQYVVQVALLVAIPNFYVFALAMPACTIISNLATAWVVNRLLPEFRGKELRRLGLGRDKRAGVRKRVAGLVFQRVCSVSRNSLDSIVISAFIGLTAVASYGNYYVVMSGVLGILGTIGTAMTAAVGNSVALESREKNLSDLRLFVFLYAMISSICATCLLCLYQPFMELWVGDELMLPFDLVVLMVVYFYVCTMGDMRTVYVDATGIWWELRWRALVEAAANIALNLALVQFLGVQGVVLATIISLFLVNFLYGSHLVFKFYFGLEHARKYYGDHFIYLGVAIAVCTVVYFATSLLPGGTVWLLLLKALVAAFCSSALLVIVYCWTRRFKDARAFARRILRRERDLSA